MLVARLSLCLIVFPLLALAQQPRYRAEVEVKLIEIDVVVTDREGKRIHGLTADDFEIFEGRRRREITNFSEYRSEATEHVARESTASTPEPRSLIILIDSLPRETLLRRTVFTQLSALVSKVMRPGDRASIVYWRPGVERPEALAESPDESAIQRVLGRLAGQLEAFDAAEAADLAADLDEDFRDSAAAASVAFESGFDGDAFAATSARFAAELEIMRIRRKTSAIRRMIGTLGGQPGKKMLLYVAHDLPMPRDPSTRQSALAMYDDLAGAANAAGLTVYAIRPHIPPPDAPPDELQRQLDSLNRLADATGGLVDFGAVSLAKLGENITEDLSSYYSLAYRAESDGSDRERRIVVKATNRAFQVRARTSFVEKSAETLAREMLLARLFDPSGNDELSFEMRMRKPTPASRNRLHVPLVLKIPTAQLRFAEEKGQQVARLKVFVASANGIAEVNEIHEDELRIVSPRDTKLGFITYEVTLLADRRGSDISIGVFDSRSGLAGVNTLAVRP